MAAKIRPSQLALLAQRIQFAKISRLSCLLLVALVILLVGTRTGWCDLRDEFETPDPVWVLSDTDCAQITARRRLFEQAHRGQGCEFVQLACSQGSNAYLTYAIPCARVIDELSAEVWVKSNRGGLQMMLRVVLPHATNPRDGRPLSRLISGSVYSTPGRWQRLSVERPWSELRSQIPSLRSQFGSDVSPREAYADMVVVNAYGGAGVTNVFLDDLEVRQVVSDPVVSASYRENEVASFDVARSGPSAGERAAGERAGGERALGERALGERALGERALGERALGERAGGERAGGEPQASSGSAHPTGLRGGLLSADGRPFFPRVVEYRGESLEYLKALGFNAIQLPAPPEPALFDAARRLGLWLVCPPPPDVETQPLDSRYDRVLAWTLGQGWQATSLDQIESQAAWVRRADQATGRPLLCGAMGSLPGYSRAADILLFDRESLGVSLSPEHWAPWLRAQQRSCRLGALAWATIPTQQSIDLERQLAAFAPDAAVTPLVVDPNQLRLLAFSALSAGMRGLCFRSRSPLDATDEATRLRARSLQLVNLELQQVEPWIGGGEFVDLHLDQPEVQFGVWQTERSRLLIGVRQSPDQQHVMAATGKQLIHADIHGAPATDQAFQVTANGPRSLRQRRGSGTRIALEDAPLVSLVVLTENPLVIHHLNRVSVDNRQRRAQLHYELASAWLDLVEQVHQQLSSQTREVPDDERRLRVARSRLVQSRRLLDGQDYPHAEEAAVEAIEELAKLRREHWDRAVEPFASPVSSPLCVCFETLPLHWALAHRLRGARWSANSLLGGDFEDLDQMRRQGWSQRRQAPEGMTIEVELTQDQPRQGRYALRIKAQSREWGLSGPTSPPVVIESAPIPVQPGALVRIQGWTRVTGSSAGHYEGLIVADTLGGPSLALRVQPSDGWQPFELYRAVPGGERQMRVVLSLTGQGEASIDDVTVTTLRPLSVSPELQRQR